MLLCADPVKKAHLGRETAAAWRSGQLAPEIWLEPPARPARPDRPELLAPRHMPRRRAAGSEANRIALLHALAHIEFNAIDLAWDLIARFGPLEPPRSFFDDWVDVADDEGRHFLMLEERLGELGAAYGDLPAHGGLWESAEVTAHDILARLAIVPLVLEARGLDVTPATIENLRAAGDGRSAGLLDIILADEITHVAAGVKWFQHFCAGSALHPETAFPRLVRTYFRGRIKEPFNDRARQAAGFPQIYYSPRL